MSKENAVLTLGGAPRVNLLPPEVALRKKAKSARRGLVALVVLIALAVAAGYTLATLRAMSVQSELAASQARTAELLLRQLEFSDVTVVTSQLQAVRDARSVATSTEVLWNEYYLEVRNALPADANLTTLTVDGRAPWEPEAPPVGPLRHPRVATLTFVVSSPTPLEASRVVERLESIPGFADVTVDILDRDGEVFETSFTLNVGADALANRFPAGVAQ